MVFIILSENNGKDIIAHTPGPTRLRGLYK
jgi:hypothetical protein